MRNVVSKLDEDLRFGNITSEEYGRELYRQAALKLTEMTRSFSVIVLSDRDHCGGADAATIEEVREMVKCEMCTGNTVLCTKNRECLSVRFLRELNERGHAMMSTRESVGDWFDAQSTIVVYTNPKD
ncbi:hypothetical protein SEA_STELLA_88 [Streptomyces phage Stella]|nr:hypothetical protein SEA_STELLA_88 [Streptomyces phage Stella]